MSQNQQEVITMCAGPLRPKPPAPPPPPEKLPEAAVAPETPTQAGGGSQAASDQSRRRRAQGQSARSTILTGSRGVQDGAGTATKTLLGQ